MKTIKDIDVTNKKVIVRVDYNVPIINDRILDNNRIVASLETINYLLSKNAKIILMSHLGKIKTKSDLIKTKISGKMGSNIITSDGRIINTKDIIEIKEI